MRDYTYLYRRELSPDVEWPIDWDIFISAFDLSERVKRVYERVHAGRKLWIIHEEYGFGDSELPTDQSHTCRAMCEASMIDLWKEHLEVDGGRGARICVDVTGFMRPQLLTLLYLLVSNGVARFDVIYSEQDYYIRKDETEFSGEHVEDVKQVAGYEGTSDLRVGGEVLIIGAGYETHLVEVVADEKDRARKIVMLGLPSVRADMYQQSAWRTWRAEGIVEGATAERCFAPASDPLATATVLSELVARERNREALSHLYLAPLATNAQAVGFALCYLSELRESNASIIFPFTPSYEKETSLGFSRAWLNTLEFEMREEH